MLNLKTNMMITKVLRGGPNSGWREWGRHVNWRCGNFLPEKVIAKLATSHFNPGYSSHYMFPKQVALEARELQSSRGLRGNVGGYYLILDFDNGTEQVKQAETQLMEMGLAYDLYSSGGKGFHIYIFHECVWSKHLPYSHYHWVDTNFDLEIDLSIFQHSRLIALPGRVHKSTGQRKQLLKTVTGNLLNLEIVEMPERELMTFEKGEKTDQLMQGLLRCITLLQAEPRRGNRHTALWGTAKDLLGGGLHPKAVYDILSKINNQWTNSKDGTDVIEAIEQAIKSHTR